MRLDTEWTWAKVEAAAAATAGWRRTRRGEWRGPCQCGGEVNRAWVRRGRRANVLAGCNAGCSGPDVIAWLTGDELARPGRAFPPRRNEWPRPRPLGRCRARARWIRQGRHPPIQDGSGRGRGRLAAPNALQAILEPLRDPDVFPPVRQTPCSAGARSQAVHLVRVALGTQWPQAVLARMKSRDPSPGGIFPTSPPDPRAARRRTNSPRSVAAPRR